MTVPAGWVKLKIEEISKSVKSGATPLRSRGEHYFQKSGTPWVKTMDLTNGNILKTQESITDLALKETSCSIFPKDTILVAMYGGFNQIGRTGILTFPAAINQAISAIQLKNLALPRFFIHYLNGNVDSWKVFAASSRKDPNITRENVCNFPVLLPPFFEQIKIAAILSSWDDALENLGVLLTAKRKLKRGLMQQLLTGRVRFKEFETRGEAWETVCFGEFFDEVTAGEWGKEPDSSPETVPVIRSTNFTKDGRLDLSREKLAFRRIPVKKITKLSLSPGNLILEKSGGSPDQPVGRVVHFSQPEGTFLFSNFLQKLVVKNKYNSEFLYYVMQEFYLSRKVLMYQQQTTGIINFQLTDFLKFGKVAFPTASLEEQRKIALVLSTLDQEISTLEQERDALERQKRGLMQVLLTGKVRVNVSDSAGGDTTPHLEPQTLLFPLPLPAPHTDHGTPPLAYAAQTIKR